MESLWPQIERLLPRRRQAGPLHRRRAGGRVPRARARAGWPGCWSTPTPTRSACPTRGLQILYEILNERPDAVAERAYAPWVDMEAAMRAAGVPLFSVEQHLPAAAFDVLAFNLSAELVYTNVLNLIDLAGCPCTRPTGAVPTPSSWPAATAPSTPSRWPTSSTPSSWATAKRWWGRSTRCWAPGWRRRPRPSASVAALLRSLARLEGVYVPALFTPSYLRRPAGVHGPRVPRTCRPR